MSDQIDGDQVQDEGGEWEVEKPAGANGATFTRQVKEAEYTVAAMCEKLGMTIDEGDPEYRDIRWQHSDPARWADDYTEALAHKAARLGVKIRRTGGGQQQQQQPAQPKQDLAEQYKAEVRAARGRGGIAFNNIRAKYRAAGLDVENIQVFNGRGE